MVNFLLLSWVVTRCQSTKNTVWSKTLYIYLVVVESVPCGEISGSHVGGVRRQAARPPGESRSEPGGIPGPSSRRSHSRRRRGRWEGKPRRVRGCWRTSYPNSCTVWTLCCHVLTACHRWPHSCWIGRHGGLRTGSPISRRHVPWQNGSSCRWYVHRGGSSAGMQKALCCRVSVSCRPWSCVHCRHCRIWTLEHCDFRCEISATGILCSWMFQR